MTGRGSKIGKFTCEYVPNDPHFFRRGIYMFNGTVDVSYPLLRIIDQNGDPTGYYDEFKKYWSGNEKLKAMFPRLTKKLISKLEYNNWNAEQNKMWTYRLRDKKRQRRGL